jgi:aquaporin Z
MQNDARILGAETLGTTVLLLGGPGAMILQPSISTLGVAVAFGFTVLVVTFLIGPISGAHVNPAVTLGMLIGHRVNGRHAAMAWIGQVLGAVVGGAIVLAIASSLEGWDRGSFAANGWAQLSPEGYGIGAAIVVEFVFTALVVVVALVASRRGTGSGITAAAVGFTYAAVCLVTLSVDNFGVNPARSLGTALYAELSSDALQQLALFIVVPLFGAVLGVVLWLMIDETRLEGTGLFFPGVAAMRDLADHVVDEAVGAVDHAVEHAGDEPGARDGGART